MNGRNLRAVFANFSSQESNLQQDSHIEDYRKNDQAWIEQKNGAVIRKMVGYGRLEGLGPAAALARVHDVARLYVNYFQPSFKLKSKTREGAKVNNKYHVPATPADRLLASDRVSVECNPNMGNGNLARIPCTVSVTSTCWRTTIAAASVHPEGMSVKTKLWR
jgi:hypothetical protein